MAHDVACVFHPEAFTTEELDAIHKQVNDATAIGVCAICGKYNGHEYHCVFHPDAFNTEELVAISKHVEDSTARGVCAICDGPLED